MSRSYLFLLFFCLLLASCAHNKFYDRDKTNPQYYEGTGVALTDQVSAKTTVQNPNQLPPPDNGSDAAARSLIESGISLAAYPDYYKQSTIHGVCLLGVSPTAGEIGQASRASSPELARVPCRYMNVVLVDSAGKSVGVTQTNANGEFAFYVKKDKIYFLKLDNSKYVMAEEDRKPLSMGADVVLHALKSK